VKKNLLTLALKALSLLRKKFYSTLFKLSPFLLLALRKCQTSGTTSLLFHEYMIAEYSKSNGRLHDKLFKNLCYEPTDYLSSLVLSELEKCIASGVLSPSLNLSVGSGLSELKALKQSYIQDGYIIFPYSLNSSFVERIVESLTTSAKVSFTCRSLTDTISGSFGFSSLPSSAIVAQVRLSGISNSIEDMFVAHGLECLDSLYEILSRYLMESKLALKKHSSAWWSYPSVSASSECAQLFHFDCDSLKWIKYFSYLSDVGDINGPHVAVTCTHLPGRKSAELMKRGYARISDDEIITSLNSDQQLVEYCYPRGTIIIADTRCWHKGTAVKQGERIMMDHVYLSHSLSHKII